MKKMLQWMAVLLLCLVPVTGSAKEPEIFFDLASGFYESSQVLSIFCDQQNATIYYTLDGTVPDENSLVYDSGITLENSDTLQNKLTQITGIKDKEDFVTTKRFPQAHVIRAVAITKKGERSETISGTYFIGYDREALYGDTPIMLLVTDSENLFNYETGIYVLGKSYDEWIVNQTESYSSWELVANYTQRGREWERPVSVEFLPAEGDGFSQEMGVRIKGNISRDHSQKSLRLIAREDYGKKNVKYELFPDNICEADGDILGKYKSFTLRNGGSDCNYAKIRDPLINNLAIGLRFETTNNMPCIAFINGEYWGIYSLTEEYSDNYIQYHYDIDNENVVTIKNNKVEDGEEEDLELYREMHDFIVDHDMTDAAYYQQAGEILDMESFIDFWAMQMYINNEDGPDNNNNWQMWRVREVGIDRHAYADGKWRMMLFDTDYSSGVYDEGKNAAEDNITSILTENRFTWRNILNVLQALVKNNTFRTDLVKACCDIRNFYFDKTRVQTQWEDMNADYAPYVPDSWHRFGPAKISEKAESRIEKHAKGIVTFFDARYDAFLPIIQEAFDLGGACAVTVQVSDPTQGQVYFNNRTIPAEAGGEYVYFPEGGLSVTAEPVWGATFTGWTVSGDAVLAHPKAMTTEITFSGDFILTANFK